MKILFNIFHGQHNHQTLYHHITVVSFSLQGEMQIPSFIMSQATRRCSSWRVEQYSITDYSELIWVYSKNDTSCIKGKWRTNSVSIKKCVSFTIISITFSIPCMPVYIYMPRLFCSRKYAFTGQTWLPPCTRAYRESYYVHHTNKWDVHFLYIIH